jgi:hypothetical protein
MAELSQRTQQLALEYQRWHKSLLPPKDASTIHVDEVASKVASFYEKISGAVDYRDEHLLRKTAVSRKLKRRMLLKKNGEDIAEPLVQELIRGGHFQNDFIEESKIESIKNVIEKYVYILKNSPSAKEGQRSDFYGWILNIAACEIEETLSPPIRENALVEFMKEEMEERIRVKNGMSESEIAEQIYIAVQQALFRLDPFLIGYNLLKKWFPDWKNLKEDRLEMTAKSMHLVREKIEKTLRHPMAEKFYKICERYDTPYIILNDILSENPLENSSQIKDPESLERMIKKAYAEKVKTLKSRTARAAFYATFSIFIANILALLAFEIPFSRYATGQFNYLAMAIDVLAPTFLMFLLVATIRPPEKRNLAKLILETVKIVYETERKDVYEIKSAKKKGPILKITTSFLYLISFLLSFGLIIWGLYQLNFPPASYFIFLIFVSLVAFTGTKIREKAKELKITDEKESVFSFLLDALSLPILKLGKWLSVRWKKYNVAAIFFGSLVDMPFQLFVEFLESWRSFLKEKKEEIR